MTVDEFIQWHKDHSFPCLSEDTLREMAIEGITFEIRDGAPYIKTDNWIYHTQ